MLHEILKRVYIAFSLLFTFISFSQSTSVFDATYFNKDNTTPPIRVGKGFHINDVYRQTRACFTPESSKQENLSSQQLGGKKTVLKVYYTQTNEEYNVFRTRGASGKISFLNLFSIGGQKLDEYANKEVHNSERIIFNANVDFGTFEYSNELQLNEEAKALIEKKNLQDFVKIYGTHYISGVRKESSVSVILTKQSTKVDEKKGTSSSLGVKGKSPYKVSGSMEVSDSDWANQQLSNNKFSAVVEINGPDIDQSSIQGKINKILNGTDADKVAAISAIIEGALKGISDPNKSVITQYYYSPFSLYGLDGINWNEKKQNLLTSINETVVHVYSAKTLLDELITESGKNQLKEELINLGIDNSYLPKFMEQYDKSVPNFKILKTKADKFLVELEARYVKCSDIYCSNPALCCNNEAYLNEINTYNLDAKIEAEEAKLTEGMEKVANEMVTELTTPDCQKKGKGIIYIKNHSSNPYNLYQGEKLLATIEGKQTISFEVDKGTYKFKASQNSGYLMYPTINYRSAVINKVCDEIILNIGFED